MNKLPELTELLKYQNKWIIERYKKDYPHNKLSAKKALKELLKYLWLSEKHSLEKKINPWNKALNFTVSMHHEMKEIDDMWHTFLLFTLDYACFCENYFGCFLHHEPNRSKKFPSEKKYKKELTNYLSYIYDHLGEKTIIQWFDSE